jgi:hypothetical protein
MNSLVMHGFWNIQDLQTRTTDKTNFMKNMTVLEAILVLLAIPLPWSLSLLP